MYELSETNYRGTGCGKAARPGLWGSGEVTNRSTRIVESPMRLIKICACYPE